MGRFFANLNCNGQNSRFITHLGIVTLILLAAVADGHTISKRHDIIESSASIEKTNVPLANDTSIIPENEGLLNESIGDEIEENHTAKGVASNVDTNNVNNVQDKVSTTTDVNNGIEQNFGGHSNASDTINRDTVTINIPNSQTNFTKDFSQDDSVENRLPSKSSDRSPSRITTVSLKEATKAERNHETQSAVSIPSTASDKPKRIDASFSRSTERTMGAIDTSTIPINRSTVSNLSTDSLAPRVTASETIRARISSISRQRNDTVAPETMAEKRAKYLSESHTGTSLMPSANNPEASWSDLKTVGEVHYNNVTLGRSAVHEDPLKTVNGKIDIEDTGEKASEASSTERNVEDHETQLQKSNSSRIVDVQEDNSLSSLPSTSNRPTISATTKRGSTKPLQIDDIQQVIGKVNVNEAEAEKANEQSTTLGADTVRVTEATSTIDASSTNRIRNIEESTIRVTEPEVYSTTEEEPTTTDEGDTTIVDDTTTLSNDPLLIPTKTKENLIAAETTTIISTTEDEIVPTTIVAVSAKGDESKIQPETTQRVNATETIKVTVSTGSNSNTTPFMTTDIDSTTQKITEMLTNPTKPITSKPTENKDKLVIPNEGDKGETVSTSTSSSTSTTQRIVPKIVPTMVHILTTLSESEPTENGPSTPWINLATSSDSVLRKIPDIKSTVAIERQTEIAQVPGGEPTDINAMIAICISVVAVVTLILLVGFLYVMRKRQKQMTYGQRCRPIGLDAYSLDNISVYNSVRRKSGIRSSKRAFGNAGFDDPGLKNNPLNITQLATFSQKRVSINDEFRDVPTVTARIEEVPIGCEDKNRYANVVPLPESRVHLKQLDDDEKTEYINANFVKGPKDTTHYYIACQAPLEHTIIDFWRMIWEQNSRVIIMATDLTENGIEKCAEYLPSSFVIDNHVTFGDYQIILKNREVRDKYAVSTVHLKNACTKTWREITHFWYQWPENGVPTDEASVIAMMLEARSYLKMVTPEQSTENGQQESDLNGKISNGSMDKNKSLQRVQGPLTVHCSPGTGRTGTIVACDIAIRSLEQPTRTVDVPQIVYFVRRGRASAVQTREQYEFIYKVAHVYATKLTGPSNDN